MPNFKPKNKKKIIINKRKQITLDHKHNEIMNDFEKQNKIEKPLILAKIQKINKQLKLPISLEQKLNLEDELMILKKKVKLISEKKKKYLLDNSKIIFDYFEKKKRYIRRC